MNFNKPPQNNEVKKNKYYYIDRNAIPPKIVFETVATTILEADKAYKQTTGNDPSKQPHIGCQSFDVHDTRKPVEHMNAKLIRPIHIDQKKVTMSTEKMFSFERALEIAKIMGSTIATATNDQKEFKLLLQDIENGTDLLDGDEIIETLRDKFKIKPVISVPERYINDVLKSKGISESDGWWNLDLVQPYDKPIRAIVGMIGRPPFEGSEGDKRIFFEVENHVDIQPRPTTNNQFHGVWVARKPFLKIGTDINQIYI